MKALTNFLAAGFLAALIVGCGSGSGTTEKNPPPPPGAVTAHCVASVQVGVTSPNYTCTASEVVTWSVSDATLATISASGVLAPNDDDKTGSVTVTATPSAGNDTPGTATVAVVDQILYDTLTYDTFIVNTDGSSPTEIVADQCYSPEWSYDHLLFVCSGVTGNTLLIYKANGIGGWTSTTLTWEGIGTPNLASPSPDGKTIVFVAYDENNREFGTYQANIDGSNLQVLSQEAPCTGSCPPIAQPRYSLDGGKIVYNHIVDGEAWVYTMNTDGSDQTPVIQGEDGAFSPDGNTIYFTSASGVDSVDADANGNTSSVVLLVPNGYGAETSPDGKRLVYGCPGNICVANIDGSQQTQLVGGSHGSWW